MSAFFLPHSLGAFLCFLYVAYYLTFFLVLLLDHTSISNYYHHILKMCNNNNKIVGNLYIPKLYGPDIDNMHFRF